MLLKTFDEHWHFINGWLIGERMYKAVRALAIGREFHDGKRKDGVTEEFFHQIGQILHARTLKGISDEHMETLVIVLALHDIVEDKQYSLQRVEDDHGPVVARSVEKLSKKYHGRPGEKPDDIYFWEMSFDRFASVGKGIDRENNQGSMITAPKSFPPEKMLKTINVTRDHIILMLDRARDHFPDQEAAYSNLINRLEMQCIIIDGFITQLSWIK